MEMKRSWCGRSYAPRGEAINIPVGKMGIPPDTIVYIGYKMWAGYVYIGRYGDVPKEYLAQTAVEIYERTIEKPGIVILTTGEGRNGPYWLWSECHEGEKMPPLTHLDPSGAEALLIAIAKDEAHWYRGRLRKALKDRSDPDYVEKAIHKVRKASEGELKLLSGATRGDYILQRIEDEAYVLAVHPEIEKLDYDKRYEAINREVQIRIKQRVRMKDESHYARIKGRSVKHDM